MKNLILAAELNDLSDSVIVLFSIIALIITLLLSYLFYRLIKANLIKLKEEAESLTESTLSKIEMRESIEYYIGKIGGFGVFSLLFFDIDNFTALNDLFGKEKCDNILAELANRIVKTLPYRASLARLQKDEFLIFIKDEYSADDLQDIAQKLLETVREPFTVLRDEEINLTASVGMATYPTSGQTYKELLANLELAAYVTKRNGGNAYTMYYHELSTAESANMEYFKEVKDAIKRKEFCLFYQPIINIRTNEIFAFESLIRWNHPVHGILPPFKFINILEQSGDINWVGQWGVEQLAKQLVELKVRGNNIKLSINLSTKQLLDEMLAENFKKITKKYRINNNDIILEIAEFAMYDKMATIKTNLLKLRDAGFIIAVDGFGLDYATIAKIEKEPIDMIKLDRGFLEDIDNNFMKEKFVNMLVDYAKTNERFVVSEGIENLTMENYIKKNKIDFGQGYYYSKPIEESELLNFIDNKPWLKQENNVETNE